jgi:hypothetical protein
MNTLRPGMEVKKQYGYNDCVQDSYLIREL